LSSVNGGGVQQTDEVNTGLDETGLGLDEAGLGLSLSNSNSFPWALSFLANFLVVSCIIINQLMTAK